MRPVTLSDATRVRSRAKVTREARFATQDAKRRKMREELEKRERTVAAARDEEAAARAKLKVRGSMLAAQSASPKGDAGPYGFRD